MDRTFLGLDIESWIKATIQKAQCGSDWDKAWIEAYVELGGSSENSGNKSCPKNAARVLYETGRIKNSGQAFVDISLPYVWQYDSKNGVYALLAIDELQKNPEITYQDLVSAVHDQSNKIFGIAPASDQGAIKITYKLYNIGLIANKLRS